MSSDERHLLSAADEHLEAAADALKPLLRHPPVPLTGDEAQHIGHTAITELAKTRNKLRFATRVIRALREDLTTEQATSRVLSDTVDRLLSHPLTLAQVRDGTGFPPGTLFAPLPPGRADQ